MAQGEPPLHNAAYLWHEKEMETPPNKNNNNDMKKKNNFITRLETY